MPPVSFRQLTRDQFAHVLEQFPFTRRIDAVHMHHTWKPDHGDYVGLETIVGMWRFHTQVNGWSDIAQHISIAPDGTIWTGRNWNRAPASAAGYNGSSVVGPFMFETIGNFDRGRDRLRGEQLESVVAVIALVQRRFELPVETLRFHRSMTDQKSCPGTSVEHDEILTLVANYPAAPMIAKRARKASSKSVKRAAAKRVAVDPARADEVIAVMQSGAAADDVDYGAELLEDLDPRGGFIRAPALRDSAVAVRTSDKGETIARAGGGKARTVIYVHGIGNKPEPSILKCQWDRALFGFDLAERSRLAYWVNRGYYPEPSPGTCASGDVTELEVEPTGRSLSIKRHMETVSLEDEVAQAASENSDPAVLYAIAAKMEASAAPPTIPDKAVAGVRATALPLPRWMREWITRRLVRAFVRDVNDFFYEEKRHTDMCDSVHERLRVGGGPFVVIGHSQGSMVAYKVLSELDPAKYEVDLFVTIGSPLGIEEVQDQMKRLTGQSKLAIPRCVKRWLNFADRLDPVALDASLRGEYTGGAALVDTWVNNPDGPRHPHSGSGYLRTEEVRTAIAESVEKGLFQRVAPFVVARDMARQLENHASSTRHKVLIELAQTKSESSITLRETGDRLVAELLRIAGDLGSDEEQMGIDRMQRFVSAELTREETESLAQRGAVQQKLLTRIWRNSTKRVLLDVSCQTVQGRTAHAGYDAVGRGIEWAVLDTGVVRHQHFREYENIVSEVDCTRRGEPRVGQARDENGHGTHVAGIIAGIGRFPMPSRAMRVFSGLAPEAKLHVYKTLNNDGEGDDAWIIKALDHIAKVNEEAGELRIHGVNLSLGGPFDQSVFGCGHTPLCRELRRLWRQGVVVVLAAGNEGFAELLTAEGTINANIDLSIGDPANLEEAISVGSVHKESPQVYGISWFSSRGPTADGRQKPDLVAPGERIMSCRHDIGVGDTTPEQLYVEMGGTSMAAPHVSGLIAGFLSARKGFIGDPDRVKRILLENCTDLGRDRAQQGAGLANLTKMLLNT
jgi:subtilisin family serine protease/pimeloyl-ACP methyl ester carboxylesterase